MTERLFKVLDRDGTPFHGGIGAWSLPARGEPGAWMPPIADLEPCERGYHLCREGDLVCWLGPMIGEAEARGERVDYAEKRHTCVVVAEARLLRRYERWTETTARLFACDCAERVLYLCADDALSRKSITTARNYANGIATQDELSSVWVAAASAGFA